ncbi:hypothetical protein JX266_011513 [Neoarthrinium moseri]|nr:hypothetical protein JX266_011513 [Neoarthrinium moseri]
MLATPTHSREQLSLDLSRFDQVRRTAKIINSRVAAGEIASIQAIALNAGYEEFETQTRTEDGLDMTFAVNYLGHWLLTLLLLQSMDREKGRVIWISSWSHNPHDKLNMEKTAYTDKRYRTTIQDDLGSIAKGTWSANKNDTLGWAAGWRQYGATKLCSVTMMYVFFGLLTFSSA